MPYRHQDQGGTKKKKMWLILLWGEGSKHKFLLSYERPNKQSSSSHVREEWTIIVMLQLLARKSVGKSHPEGFTIQFSQEQIHV